MPEAPLTLAEVARATAGTAEDGAGASVTGVSIDSRTIGEGELFVAIAGPRFDGHAFVAEAARRGARAALVHRDPAPAAALPLVRVADTTRALADLGRYARGKFQAPVVAITGSAGKTTTKDMTAALLATKGPVLKTEGNLNNQYGLPLNLLRLAPEHAAAVLELGMSARGELRMLSGIAQPDVAVITLVAPVHLEFFASVDEIAEAKAEILEGLRPGGIAVLNGEDPRVRKIGERHRAAGHEVVWFGRDRAYEVSAENWRGTVHGMRFDMRVAGQSLDVALPLPGPHFLMNFLAAAAVAFRLGVAPDTIAATATTIQAASHRGQVVTLADGITLLDDSYNSNPAAVEAAVQALDMSAKGRRVAFLGDMLELGPSGEELHRRTGENVGRKLDAMVGVGALAKAFLEGARQAGMRPDALRHFPDSKAAASAAAEIVRPGDAVLVKGSRGVRMEAVVDALRARFGAREG